MKSTLSRTASLACASALLLFGFAPLQPAAGQGPATFTTTQSLQVGAVHAVYIAQSITIGPGSLVTGTLSGCTLVGSPPYAGCSPTGGSGTLNDPFAFSCSSSLPLAGCSGGVTVNVPAGHSNSDIHTHRVAPTGTTSTVTFSTAIGSSYANYTSSTEVIGPATITVGAMQGCALTGSPPFAGCSLGGGSGTAVDPFQYSCSNPLPLTGCSGGYPLVVLAGTSNIDFRSHRVLVTGNTFTSSFSSQPSAVNARYIWTSEAIGPSNIVVGTLSGCTLVGSPPFAGCNPNGGSGTVGDPFLFGCSAPLPLVGCSGGIPFIVPSQTVNLDLRTHTVGASNTTSTATFSSQAGASNAIYVWVHETIGPATIAVGTLTGCMLTGSPPFAGCILGGGSGTVADPFAYSCSSPPPLAGCGGGTPFVIPGGNNNFDSRIHQVIAAAAISAAVPMGPWVPFASAAGVLIAFVLVRRRARRTN